MNLSDFPIYDTATLPILVNPLTITRRMSNKYLGGRYLKEKIELKFSYFARSREQLNALNTFWEDDCDSGTGMFALEIDVLGIESNNNIFIVSWASDFAPNVANASASGNMNFMIEYKLDALNDAYKF